MLLHRHLLLLLYRRMHILRCQPPAPAGESPDGAPADAPSTAAEKSFGKSASVNVKASGVFTVAVTALSAFVVSFVFMS